MTDAAAVADVHFTVIEHELTMPFVISGGGMDIARAVIISVELTDGSVGLGESAPFPAVSGETIESTLASLGLLRNLVTGLSACDALALVGGNRLGGSLADAPAARCGMELALLDACLRSTARSLADWMPPAVTTIDTDITLPVCQIDEALGFVDEAVRKGFRILKVKIGGRRLHEDLAIIADLRATFPTLELILDANCAYDYDTAFQLLARLDAAGVSVSALEQPLPRYAIEDMNRLQAGTDVTICLDESVQCLADLESIQKLSNIRLINVKTMKMGVATAISVLTRAGQTGMKCMVGGMVESRLSMTVSAALAMHFAEVVRFVDLDTPLFMHPGPVSGGMQFAGSTISIPPRSAGHGCSLSGA
jgi:o-succinylbenzoate synthase